MKILIAYFSNTGNTEKVAIAMNEALLEHSIDLLKVKDVESERLQDYELVILGSGIYAGKIHKSVVDLVKNADVLPPKFVLINTHASQGAYQHGFKMVKKKIEACNSVILGEWDCRGENKGIPENMLQQRLNSLPPEERKKAEEELIALKGHPNAKDLADAQKFIKNIIKSRFLSKMRSQDEKSIEDQIKDLALNEGAVLVGICSAESIQEEESSNANYLLPGAQSIISIAINYSDEAVHKYLAKETQELLSIEEGTITKNLKAIGEKIKVFLEDKGFKTVNCDINFDYRFVQQSKLDVVGNLRTMIDLINKEKDINIKLTEKEQKALRLLKKAILNALRKTPMDLMPEMSHRRAAVAAGLGRIGWSGNVITEKYGARVLLNSVITIAKLKPDKQLEKNPCIDCRLCEKSCQGGLFARDEKQTITIAGVQETIAKRNSYAYCIAVCSGMIGQNKFDNWSTWSPFRLDNDEKLPLDDNVIDYVQNMFPKAVEKGGEEAENVLRLTENSYKGLNEKKIEDFISTCGFCQLVCGPTIQDKKGSYKSIVDSGCAKKL